MWKTIALQHVKCVGWSGFADEPRTTENDNGEFGRVIGEGAPESLSMDGSGVPVNAPYHPESHLEELCRGIGEQVRIFGGKGKAGPKL